MKNYENQSLPSYLSAQLLSHVRLFVTPWTVAHQASLSMGFSRQEYWSGLSCPSPGDLPDPGIKPRSPALQADSLPSLPQIQFNSVQSLSHVRLFTTPWIAARQASLSITNSRSSPKLMSIESVKPSSHLILCRPLFLLPPIPPSIRGFSNESILRMRWPKYWSFSFSHKRSLQFYKVVFKNFSLPLGGILDIGLILTWGITNTDATDK